MVDLSFDVVSALVESGEDFPIDFDHAWRWIEYSSKQTAEECLKASLDEGFDFLRLTLKNTGKRGRPAKHIRLTVDGFKMFCQAAGTEKAKQVRRYFVECERELKRRLSQDSQQAEQDGRKRLIAAMISKDCPSKYPKFMDSFYEMLYRKRGQGWENRDPRKRPPCVAKWTNKVVYDRLLGSIEPGGVKDTLNQVNPVRADGTRKDKHHWHFKDLGVYHLNAHFYALAAVANTVSDGDWDKFIRKVEQAFPNGEALQMNLLDLLDEMESTVN